MKSKISGKREKYEVPIFEQKYVTIHFFLEKMSAMF